MNLKLAIWDMDGTIIDSRAVIQTAMEAAFTAVGLQPPSYEQTRRVVGLDLTVACARLAPDQIAADELEALVEAYRVAFVRHRAIPGFKEPLYPGALEALERLANENWCLAIATGKSHNGLRAIFEMHDLKRYFDTIWCADDGPGKPHPFMIEQAMKAIGAKPEDTVMIGDAVFDVQMAKAAAIEAHGVSWGFGRAEELLAAGADEIHHDFESLGAGLDVFGQSLGSKPA